MTTLKNKNNSAARLAAENVDTPPKKLIAVKLTRGELIHVRDLFGVLLPSAAAKTLSQSLAERAGRPMVEACLWRKLERACESMGVPLGDDAPDFAVSIGSVPELTVFQIETDADDGSNEGGDLETILEVEDVPEKSVKKPRASKGRT